MKWYACLPSYWHIHYHKHLHRYHGRSSRILTLVFKSANRGQLHRLVQHCHCWFLATSISNILTWGERCRLHSPLTSNSSCTTTSPGWWDGDAGCEGEADPSNATVHERGYVMLPTVTPDYGVIFGMASWSWCCCRESDMGCTCYKTSTIVSKQIYESHIGISSRVV